MKGFLKNSGQNKMAEFCAEFKYGGENAKMQYLFAKVMSTIC